MGDDWVKLTKVNNEAAWVNLSRAVEIEDKGDRSIIWFAFGGKDPQFMAVTEKPDAIMCAGLARKR